ncbi:MAG: c-type cytochrome, partial [Lysobacteraceae bacterium]
MPRWLRNSLLALAALAVAGLALSWRPSIDAAAPPGRQAFAPGLIEQGARLAAVGNCVSCHTASPSSPFAGGRPMETPFGTVYSTNITPDAATGIGAWPEAAFARALREGVARDGSHLYPAFPYDHYTRLTDRDIHALYAYVMTREPVTAPARSNRLVFPLNFRPLLAGWKLLFLDRTPWTPVAGHDDSWNRGAYLSDALGHCSACHSPRNALGAEDRKRYLDGGDAEGWHATALNASSPSPLPWTVDK